MAKKRQHFLKQGSGENEETFMSLHAKKPPLHRVTNLTQEIWKSKIVKTTLKNKSTIIVLISALEICTQSW